MFPKQTRPGSISGWPGSLRAGAKSEHREAPVLAEDPSPAVGGGVAGQARNERQPAGESAQPAAEKPALEPLISPSPRGSLRGEGVGGWGPPEALQPPDRQDP